MLIKPDYNELIERVGSKYRVCVIAAKRAAQLIDNAVQLREGKAPRHRAAMVDSIGQTALYVALEEIASGYIVAAEPKVEEVFEAEEVAVETPEELAELDGIFEGIEDLGVEPEDEGDES